jgi:hypothetical protein
MKWRFKPTSAAFRPVRWSWSWPCYAPSRSGSQASTRWEPRARRALVASRPSRTTRIDPDPTPRPATGRSRRNRQTHGRATVTSSRAEEKMEARPAGPPFIGAVAEVWPEVESRLVEERGQTLLEQVGMGFQNAEHGFAVELPNVVLADGRDRKASAHHLITFFEAQHLVL